VWVGGGGLVALCLAMLASYATALLLLCFALPVGRRPSLNWRMYVMSVRFSFPLYINSLLNFLFQRLDTLVVTALMGVSHMAVYEIAKRFPTLLSRTLNALLVPFLPSMSSLLSRGRRDDASGLLNRALALTVFFGNTGVLMLVIFQVPLIHLLFTAEYLPATEVMDLLVAGICLAVQAGILSHALIALNKPFIVTVANTGMAVLSLGGSYLLLPYYGLMGAGMAWIGAAGFCAAYQAAQVLRLGLRLDWPMYLKAQSFMIFAALLLYYGDGSTLWRIIALVMYVVLCFTSRIVTMQQLARLTGALIPNQRSSLA
jgi:O-antigen/teichoic acid export membrane protein